jgi:cytoskeletal protein CcmA (bactofilin family)
MYGILVSYNTYLELSVNRTVEDVLKGNDGIQGIFTGRNGDFMIIGKVLGTVKNDKEPYVVPEIDVNEQGEIEGSVYAQFGLEGEFHYYFIKN